MPSSVHLLPPRPSTTNVASDRNADAETITKPVKLVNATSSATIDGSSSTALPVDDAEDAASTLLHDGYPSSEREVRKLNKLWTPNLETDDEPAQLPLDTIFDRTLDTVEDAVMHLRRLPFEQEWLLEPPPDDKRPTMVVLGSGWAAHALLKVADTYKYRIIVVSPSNHFVFTPMLASASVGTVEYRSMTEAVRAANPMVEYMEGTATDIDVEKRTINVKLQSFLNDVRDHATPPSVTLSYDQLVVAVGCRVNDGIVKGASKYCSRLKTCNDARRIRTSVGECLEYALRPDVSEQPSLSDTEREKRREERRRRATFVIIGGGPTGVELAAEMADFVQSVTKGTKGPYKSLRGDIRILLVHGGGELVSTFDKALRTHVFESLKKAGVEVLLNARVNEVGDGYVKLTEKGTDNMEKVWCGVSVWAAGTGPVPFVETLLDVLPSEAKKESGRIAVDKWMRCPTPKPESFGSIMVLSDAAAFENNESFLPQTAQVAGQHGAYAARLLCRGYDLKSTPPILKEDSMAQNWLKLRGLEEAPGFVFLNLGLLAYVGGGEALTQVQLGDVPIFSYAGSISFVLWRSVYLVKQVATRNRLLVTFDWMKRKLFGYDTTRL